MRPTKLSWKSSGKRIIRCLFLLAVTGFVATPSLARAAFEIDLPARGTILHIGEQAKLEWKHEKLGTDEIEIGLIRVKKIKGPRVFMIESAECLKNTGSCTWQVPLDAPAGFYSLKIRSTANKRNYVQSRKFLIVRTQLIAPQEGSVLPKEKPVVFNWNDVDHWLIDHVTIKLYEHNKKKPHKSWQQQENSGTFQWEPEALASKAWCVKAPGCYFVVYSPTHTERRIESGFFTLGTPGKGDHYEIDSIEDDPAQGTALEITWSKTSKDSDALEDAHPVRLVLLKGGEYYLTIASGVTSKLNENNTYSYTWDEIPYTVVAGEGYAIEITDEDDGTLWGRSKSFEISGTESDDIKVTVPDVPWNLNQQFKGKIEWTKAKSRIKAVRVDLYKNGRLIKAAEEEVTSNSLYWNIPDTLLTGDDYTSRVQDVNDKSAYAFSDPFCIQRSGETCLKKKTVTSKPVIESKEFSNEEAELLSWCADQTVGEADDCHAFLGNECVKYGLSEEACTWAAVDMKRSAEIDQPELTLVDTPVDQPETGDISAVAVTTCNWEAEPAFLGLPVERGRMLLKAERQSEDGPFTLYLTDVFSNGGRKVVEQLIPPKKWVPNLMKSYQTFEGNHALSSRPIEPGSVTLIEIPVTPPETLMEAMQHTELHDSQIENPSRMPINAIDHQSGRVVVRYPRQKADWIAKYASPPVAGLTDLQAAEMIDQSTEAASGIFVLAHAPIVPGTLDLLAVYLPTGEDASSEEADSGALARISDDGTSTLLTHESTPAGTINYQTGEITFDPPHPVGTAVFATYLRKFVDETLTPDATGNEDQAAGIAPDSQYSYASAEDGEYTGEYKDDKKHGHGTWTLADGSVYVGEFEDGQPNGEGTFTFSNGGMYVGQWKDGKEHGEGTFTSSDGGMYVGQWKDGKEHGQGTWTHADRTEYSGEWEDGRLKNETASENSDTEFSMFSFSGDNAISQTPIVPGSIRITIDDVTLADSHYAKGQLVVIKGESTAGLSTGQIDYESGELTLDLEFDPSQGSEFRVSYYAQVPGGHGQIKYETDEEMNYKSVEVTIDRRADVPDELVCVDFILSTAAHNQAMSNLLSAIETESATLDGFNAAEITGVTDYNLDAINAAIAAARPAPTTAEEIQVIVDAVNATLQQALLTAGKYLRNVTSPNKNPPTADITYNGIDYFARGVKARRKDTLEFLIVITNGRDADATDLVFSDNLPDSTTYITGSAAVDTDGDERFDVTAGDGGETEGPGDGIILMSGNQITVYIGVGGTDAPGSESGGIITGIASAPNNKSAILYQFTPKQREHRRIKAHGSIVVGNAYGKRAHGYRVTALLVNPAAPSGNYTFLANSGNAGLVELKRDGEVVYALSYDWQTKVGAGNTYTFKFPGYLSISVTKRGAGTMNLYALPESLFNDAETVVVP